MCIHNARVSHVCFGACVVLQYICIQYVHVHDFGEQLHVHVRVHTVHVYFVPSLMMPTHLAIALAVMGWSPVTIITYTRGKHYFISSVPTETPTLLMSVVTLLNFLGLSHIFCRNSCSPMRLQEIQCTCTVHYTVCLFSFMKNIHVFLNAGWCSELLINTCNYTSVYIYLLTSSNVSIYITCTCR